MKPAFYHLTNALTIWLFIPGCRCKFNYEIALERIEAIQGSPEQLVDYSQLKISRTGGNYTFNGNVVVSVDMDESFLGEITTAYSSLGSSQFVSQPYNVPKTPLCTFFKTVYKKFIEPTFLDHTDFPVIPPEGLCPIPKGKYFMKGAAFDYKNYPTHMLKGLWRVEKRFFKENNCIGGLRLIFNVR